MLKHDSASSASDNEATSHPDSRAVDQFCETLKQKLALKRTPGRDSWQLYNAGELSAQLWESVAKGDPVDVACLAMMIHQHGHKILGTYPNGLAGEALEVLRAVQEQFKRFGERLPDGFDWRVTQGVDDCVAALESAQSNATCSHGDTKGERPYCVVRGVLYGGRALCGSVINALHCGQDGPCEYQSAVQRVPVSQAEDKWPAQEVILAQDYDALAQELRAVKAQLNAVAGFAGSPRP